MARADPLFAAAGDIACAPGSATGATTCRQGQTAQLILSAAPTAVATLGDNQYDSGTYAEFTGAGAFDSTWGRFKALIHPSLGNHEYGASPTADGYFAYFGAAAGDPARGYYSYDIGSWHVVALNSGCSDSVCENSVAGAVTTAETHWLESDLAAHAGTCTLAYWHHPRFSSGLHGDNAGVAPLWSALYDAHADVVLNGHDHDYERFAPQDPMGVASDAGIREFVVGTGGSEHYSFPGAFEPNSQVRDDTDFGALFLTLHAGSYDWRFESENGTTLDSGSTACHYRPPAAATNPASDVSPSGATLNGHVNPDGQGSTYHFDWGTTTEYGNRAPAADASAGTGSDSRPVSQPLAGLEPATTYHFRLVATNAAGTSVGPDGTFATTEQASTAPPPPDPPVPPAARHCRLGRLPDRSCTPGAAHRTSAARQCRRTRRPRSPRIAAATASRVYREYGMARASAGRRIDELIPPELGGSASIRNLWPQSVSPPPGFREKNRLERTLLRHVCARRMSLRRARRLLTRDWIAAYRRVG